MSHSSMIMDVNSIPTLVGAVDGYCVSIISSEADIVGLCVSFTISGLGAFVGVIDGTLVGDTDGLTGDNEGVIDGINDGDSVGFIDEGITIGISDGALLGLVDGPIDGDIEGYIEGAEVGIPDGLIVGAIDATVGTCDGDKDGEDDGLAVGSLVDVTIHGAPWISQLSSKNEILNGQQSAEEPLEVHPDCSHKPHDSGQHAFLYAPSVTCMPLSQYGSGIIIGFLSHILIYFVCVFNVNVYPLIFDYELS